VGEQSASSPEAVKGDRVGGGVGDDLLLGRALLGEGHDRVQAGGDTGQPECRRVLGNGGAQPVAPAAVAQPAAPQVPVEGPGGQQVGQYELVQNWVVAVGQPFGLHHRLQQPRWQGEPGQPQAGAR